MKPIEVFGVFIGLAGLGVGAWALFRRQATTPPAAVHGQPAPQPARSTGAQYMAEDPNWDPNAWGGTSQARLPPGSAQSTINTVVQGISSVSSIVHDISGIAALFGGGA